MSQNGEIYLWFSNFIFLIYILAGQDMIKNWIWTVPFSDKRGSLFVFERLPKRKNGNGGINAVSPTWTWGTAGPVWLLRVETTDMVWKKWQSHPPNIKHPQTIPNGPQTMCKSPAPIPCSTMISGCCSIFLGRKGWPTVASMKWVGIPSWIGGPLFGAMLCI